MPLIKRYPNRKLYDTDSKQYITLAEISALIREGQEIRVIDNATGEDLTAQTLTQVIAELERKPGGFLPGNILAGLIQAGGDRLFSLQRNIVSTMGLWRYVDDEIHRRVDILVQRGDLGEAEGDRLVDKLTAVGRPAAPANYDRAHLDQEIEQVLVERGIPSRQDLAEVLSQLDALAHKLDEMGEAQR